MVWQYTALCNMPHQGYQLAVPCFLLGGAQALQQQPQQSRHWWRPGWMAVTLTLSGFPDLQICAGCCLPVTTNQIRIVLQGCRHTSKEKDSHMWLKYACTLPKLVLACSQLELQCRRWEVFACNGGSSIGSEGGSCF